MEPEARAPGIRRQKRGAPEESTQKVFLREAERPSGGKSIRLSVQQPARLSKTPIEELSEPVNPAPPSESKQSTSEAALQNAIKSLNKLTNDLEASDKRNKALGHEVQESNAKLAEIWGLAQQFRIGMMQAFPAYFQNANWTLETVVDGNARRLPMEYYESRWVLRDPRNKAIIELPERQADLGFDRNFSQLSAALKVIITIAESTQERFDDTGKKIEALQAELSKQERTAESAKARAEELQAKLAKAEGDLKKQRELAQRLNAELLSEKGKTNEANKIVAELRKEKERVESAARENIQTLQQQASDAANAERESLQKQAAAAVAEVQKQDSNAVAEAQQQTQSATTALRLLQSQLETLRGIAEQKSAEAGAGVNQLKSAYEEYQRIITQREQQISTLQLQLNSEHQDKLLAQKQLNDISAELQAKRQEIDAQRRKIADLEAMIYGQAAEFKRKKAEEMAEQSRRIRELEEKLEAIAFELEQKNAALLAAQSSQGAGDGDRPPDDRQSSETDARTAEIVSLRAQLRQAAADLIDARRKDAAQIAELRKRNDDLERLIRLAEEQHALDESEKQQLREALDALNRQIAEDEAKGGNAMDEDFAFQNQLAAQLRDARAESSKLRMQTVEIKSAETLLEQSVAQLKKENSSLRAQLAEARRALEGFDKFPVLESEKQKKKKKKHGFEWRRFSRRSDTAAAAIITYAFLR
jgi:chromosome segregation ATPase